MPCASAKTDRRSKQRNDVGHEQGISDCTRPERRSEQIARNADREWAEPCANHIDNERDHRRRERPHADLASVCVTASAGPIIDAPKNDAPKFILGALAAGSVRNSTSKGTASALVNAGARNSHARSVRARRFATRPPSTMPAIPPGIASDDWRRHRREVISCLGDTLLGFEPWLLTAE